MKPTEVPPANGGSRVAVCIASRRRPDQLQRLLQSLERAREELGDAWEVRAYVVDNDPAGSAMGLAPHLPSWVRLFHEPREGIPYARNRTLEEGLPWADWIAFVDDDETVSETWLVELLRVQRSSGAEAVAGPVIPRFDQEPPAWIRKAKIFDRPRHRTGQGLRVAKTGNVILRAAALDHMNRWFDPRFALTGGSDSDFFERLHKHGSNIVWSDGAVVYEHVPSDRMTLRWFLQREFRLGNNRPLRWRTTNNGSLRYLLLIMFGAVGEIAIGLSVAVLALAGKHHIAITALGRVTRGLGSLAGLCGYRYEEYRRSAPEQRPRPGP